MRTNKKQQLTQRKIVSQKIERLGALSEPAPPSGWVKAIRGSLGLSIRQLADRVGVGHGSINQLEKREPKKRVEHSMRLEAQGTSDKEIALEIARVARELKESGDARIWATDGKKTKKASK